MPDPLPHHHSPLPHPVVPQIPRNVPCPPLFFLPLPPSRCNSRRKRLLKRCGVPPPFPGILESATLGSSRQEWTNPSSDT